MPIRFEFHRLLSGWWMVTVGRSPDDIEYSVVVNGRTHTGHYTRLDELISLYECAVLQIPTDEHPTSCSYQLRETETGGELSIDGEWVVVGYSDLQRTLEPFLANLFVALDEQSRPEEREPAFAFMENKTLRSFEEIYQSVLDSEY